MVMPFDERGMVPVPMPFSAFYTSPTSVVNYVTDANVVEIDIIRGVDTVAADLVNRGTSSIDTARIKTITSGKYTNLPRKFPLVESLSSINSNQLFDRRPGETPHQMVTRQDRLAELARDQHETHIRQHVMTREILRRQAMLTGKHDAIFGQNTSELEYDFHRSSDNEIPVTTPWDNAANTIVADIDSGIQVLQQGAFLTEDAGGYGALMGSDAFAAFKADTTIFGDADNRRYQFVNLGGDVVLPPEFNRFRDAGLNPRGKLETDEGHTVWIFTYTMTYVDTFTTPGVSTRTDWMPKDQCLIFHPNTRCDSYYGPMDRLPFTADEIAWYQEFFGFSMVAPPMPAKVMATNAVDSRMFYCDAIRPSDNKAIVARTQSAGIYPTTQTDGFVLLTGLITP
jgi:hypothetical protein